LCRSDPKLETHTRQNKRHQKYPGFSLSLLRPLIPIHRKRTPLPVACLGIDLSAGNTQERPPAGKLQFFSTCCIHLNRCMWVQVGMAVVVGVEVVVEAMVKLMRP
jgi:hypothetical protein